MPESTTELQQTQLKEAIKELLKRNGYTYSDLAKLLGCSVPTAKRFMNKEELSLSRLLTICDWLDVNLGQLEEIASHVEVGAALFTKEQEDFLAENPHFLSYYVRMTEGLKPQEIAKEAGISALASQKYLIGLEKVGLLRTTATGRITRTSKGTPMFRPGGRLAKTHYERIIDHSARFFKEHLRNALFSQTPSEEQRNRVGYSFKSLELSQASIAEYITRVRKLREDFDRISEHEKKVLPEGELKELTTVSGYYKSDEISASVPAHKDVFGDIIEI